MEIQIKITDLAKVEVIDLLKMISTLMPRHLSL